MSVNRFLPHVLVLPEDDANLQLANEFHVQVNQLRQMQVLEVAGGWHEVLNLFEEVHVHEMERCPTRFMILLIDFDNNFKARLKQALDRIPPHLHDRVFVLGCLSEPEALRQALGSYKAIGKAMAKDCRERTVSTWGHELLQHNAGELERLREAVVPILFPA